MPVACRNRRGPAAAGRIRPPLFQRTLPPWLLLWMEIFYGDAKLGSLSLTANRKTTIMDAKNSERGSSHETILGNFYCASDLLNFMRLQQV